MADEIVELTPEQQIDWDKLQKRNQIEKALLDAHNVETEYKAKLAADAEPKEVPDTKRTQNLIIAGDGEKAKLLGNVSTEPVYTSVDLEAMGFEKSLADSIIAEAAALRKFAVEVNPIGTVKPK